MAIQLEKENSKFNIYEQHFLIDSAADLQNIENQYTCHQGDKAELPDGSYYLRHSDDYQGELWELAKSSGGGVEVEALTVTQNKTYTAPEGKAYSPVTVNVPNTYAAGDEGKVVSSGALVSQSSSSVTENGTVDTTLINSLEVNVPQGGGSSVEEKDVNFIDYDGTILYSYTAEEFAALTEMPANPSHDGLIAQGWNWTMAGAKSHTAEVGELWIGQMYTTESGATEIDVIIQETIKDIIFTISVNGVASIDFGDNTPAVEVAGNDISVSVETNHVYQHSGRYTIKVSAVSGEYSFARSETNSVLFKFSAPEGISVSTTAHERFCGYTVLCVRIGNGISTLKYRAFANCSSMESVSIPISVTAMEGGCFESCLKLNAFVFPKNYEMTSGQGGTSAIITGESVKYIAVNALSSIKHSLCSSPSLRRAIIPNTVTSIASNPTVSFAPYGSTALTKLVIPQNVATIGGSLFSLMYVLQEVHFKRTTPPSVQYSSIGNPQRFTKIYVPEGSLAAYTENSKYPKATTYSYFEE